MNESTKSITISGRISEGDHQFLMEFPLAGKVTVSEKLRHICTFFRQYHTNLEGYSACLEQLNMALRPALNDIKEMENEEGVNSELVTKLLNFVPETLSYIITQRKPIKNRGRASGSQKRLIEIEDRLFHQTLVLIESILRMALTQKSPTYNPNLMNDRLSNIQELVGMMDVKKRGK
ncbi:MAG: hypothetical protein HN996_08005 [Opitutae bacterium]|nr:hypothetical protein [Opitutae bacterium]